MSSRFAIAFVGVVACAAASNAADPSYTKDIKPFVEKYCLECHNGKQAKSGYNFETVALMLKKGKKGAGVVPESPEKSVIVLTMTGGGKVMPPKKFGKKPTADEIDVVKAWIKAGAKDDSATDAPPIKKDPPMLQIAPGVGGAPPKIVILPPGK